MKVAIISDIHSNSVALKAVMNDIERIPNIGDLWCLGDIFGYAPDAPGCFSLLGEYGALVLKSDFDNYIATNKYPFHMNGMSRRVLQWTSNNLSDDQKKFIIKLPEKISEGDFTLVHASPRMPLYEAIVSNSLADSNLPYFDTRYCLIGHTHEAGMFVKTGTGHFKYQKFEEHVKYDLTRDRIYINPGSVGCPNDRDYRAAYGVIDFNNMSYEQHRVEYDLGELYSQFQYLELPYEFFDKISKGR